VVCKGFVDAINTRHSGDEPQKIDDDDKNSSDCCYIVGACLDELRLPKNSREMLAMQDLAKNFILKSYSGKRDYVRYGKIGPRIVQAIRAGGDSAQSTWRQIYGSLQEIAPRIEQGRLQEGFDQYRSLVLGLEARFLK
jgi:hypothetical protein